jgi:hypothetical protein
MAQGKMKQWDRPTLDRLKKRYDEAVRDHEYKFTFEGDEFLTDYAKYLIEYLESRLA